MKQNYENEKNKLMDLDKNFYEYKQEVKAEKEKFDEDKSKLQQEIKELKEELETTKKKLEDAQKELKDSLDVVTNLKLESEKKKTEMEQIKTDSHNKIEEIKLKMEKASQNVFSQDKILNIISENIHFFFEQEFHLSLTNIIENIFKNFFNLHSKYFRHRGKC